MNKTNGRIFNRGVTSVDFFNTFRKGGFILRLSQFLLLKNAPNDRNEN